MAKGGIRMQIDKSNHPESPPLANPIRVIDVLASARIVSGVDVSGMGNINALLDRQRVARFETKEYYTPRNMTRDQIIGIYFKRFCLSQIDLDQILAFFNEGGPFPISLIGRSIASRIRSCISHGIYDANSNPRKKSNRKASKREIYKKPKQENKDEKPRTCTKCQQIFLSWGAGNRRCGPCAIAIKNGPFEQPMFME